MKNNNMGRLWIMEPSGSFKGRPALGSERNESTMGGLLVQIPFLVISFKNLLEV